MDASDPLAPLRERVSRLRSERDLARDELAKLQRELEQVRAARVAEARAAAQKRQQRLLLSFVLGGNVLLLGGIGAYLWHTSVRDTTLTGHVTSVTGPAPASVGEACTAHVSPEVVPLNASVVLECASQRLYGYDSFGAIACETVSGNVVSCADPRAIREDGDPSLSLDRRTGRLTLADGARWRIDIALDQAR